MMPWRAAIVCLLLGGALTSTVAAADPTPGARYREVRPAEGSGRRGLVSVPGWAVWLATGSGVVATLAYLARLHLDHRSRDT